MEKSERLSQGAQRDQHVLNHVCLLVQLLEGCTLGHLEETDFGRECPAEQLPAEPVVAEWQNQLHLPEDALGVAVVVISERNVIDALSCRRREFALDLLLEPWFVVITQFVDFCFINFVGFYKIP